MSKRVLKRLEPATLTSPIYNSVSFYANQKRSESFDQLVERSNLTRGIRKPGKFDLPNSVAQK